MSKENIFREDISHSLYEEICQRNLKLMRKIDQLNISQQSLLSENVKLKSDLDKLNNNLNNIETEVDSLESNFKALTKPLIIDLEFINFSFPTISILFLFFLSLLNNFSSLKNANKQLMKGINYV